jgi:hypothetical protein
MATDVSKLKLPSEPAIKVEYEGLDVPFCAQRDVRLQVLPRQSLLDANQQSFIIAYEFTVLRIPLDLKVLLE